MTAKQGSSTQGCRSPYTYIIHSHLPVLAYRFVNVNALEQRSWWTYSQGIGPEEEGVSPSVAEGAVPVEILLVIGLSL